VFRESVQLYQHSETPQLVQYHPLMQSIDTYFTHVIRLHQDLWALFSEEIQEIQKVAHAVGTSHNTGQNVVHDFMSDKVV